MLITRPKATVARTLVSTAKLAAKPAMKSAVKSAAKVETRIVKKAHPAEEVLNTTSVRRTRHSTTASDKSRMVAKAKQAIEEQLKLISKSEETIDAATEQIKQAYKVVEAQLKLADLTCHSYEDHVAEIVEQWTNQSRNIDPKKFRNKVTAEVFWDSIEVSLTKAKAHLTEKEINEIADVVPSQFKGKVLKIKKLGAVKRKPKE